MVSYKGYICYESLTSFSWAIPAKLKVICCFFKNKPVWRIKTKSRYNGSLELILKTLIEVWMLEPKCIFYKSPNLVRSCLKIVLIVLCFYVLYLFYREVFLTKSYLFIITMWGHSQIESSSLNTSQSFFSGPFITNPLIYLIHYIYIDR